MTSEPFCEDCPDREACMGGYPCEVVKMLDKQMRERSMTYTRATRASAVLGWKWTIYLDGHPVEQGRTWTRLGAWLESRRELRRRKSWS